MTFKHYFRRVLSLPPQVMLKKAVGLTKQKIDEVCNRKRDFKCSTFAKLLLDLPSKKLFRYFSPVSVDMLVPCAEQILALADHYIFHRFDLLGSGWVQVKHGMSCRGLEGYLYDMGEHINHDAEGRWLEGRINQANLADFQHIWRMVDRDYNPIDWHLDFKSGYRWSEDIWYKDIQRGYKPGVDIKVPWELARMQHLSQLAWAYGIASKRDGHHLEACPERSVVLRLSKGRRGGAHLKVYAFEFRNQILDFIANNPPRFGVNWYYSMEVGIRVVNWLVAYDLFRAYGAEFDEDFEHIFIRSIYEHGLHIVNNLEWSEALRHNHYLADIVGLLFVAAYLPRTPETDAWLAFSVQELIKETKLQFYPDGANFEASTSYHRLSSEMVIYATALVLGLPEGKIHALRTYNHTLLKVRPGLKPSPLPFYPLPVKTDPYLAPCTSHPVPRTPQPATRNPQSESPFPSWYFERLEKMAEFTMHITKPNNHIPQIGDNDSGRFLKLQPVYHRMNVSESRSRYANLEGYTDLPEDAIYWVEDHLDHRHLVAAINGLFGRDDFNSFTGEGWVETDLVRRLSGCVRLLSYLQPDETTAAERVYIGTKEDWVRSIAKFAALPEKQRRISEISVTDDNLLEGLKLYAYPDFGMYIYHSKRFYLSVRCGSVGRNGRGSHAHNDQLSIELNIDREDWITDPGTYLYTPLPKRRNEYRSVMAHFAPQVKGREPGCLDLSLFHLSDQAKAKVLYFGKEGFIGVHRGFKAPVYRVVQIEGSKVSIFDCATGNDVLLQNNIEGEKICGAGPQIGPALSTGYGIRYAI